MIQRKNPNYTFSDNTNLLDFKNCMAENKEKEKYHSSETMEQRHTPKVMQAVTTLLHQLSKMFESSIPNPAIHHRMDKKEFQRIMERRQALGSKGSLELEEEQEQIQRLTMSGYSSM